MLTDAVKCRKAHGIAKGVADNWCNDVARSKENKGREPSKDGRVQALEN